MKKLLAICILSVLAFLNASYLTYQNYQIEQSAGLGKISSFCDLNNTFSCTSVLSSPYSKVFGLPFTAVAMAVYPIIFLIAFLGFYGMIKRSFYVLMFMAAGGILFNSYFIYQEYTNIGVYCPLCLICSGIIITIFVLSCFGIKSKN